MTLRNDVAGLENVLAEYARAVERIEGRLDPFEAEATRYARRRHAVDGLRSRVLPRVSAWCWSLFGDPDQDGQPSPSTFWDDWDTVNDALRRARDKALSGVNWARVASESERLRGVLDRMVSPREVGAWYRGQANDSEMLALEYYADDLLRRFGEREEARALRSELARGHRARTDTREVQLATARVERIHALRIRAYQLLDAALAVLGVDSVFFSDSVVVRQKHRIGAIMKVDGRGLEVTWAFSLRPRTSGVFVPTTAPGVNVREEPDLTAHVRRALT